jgi:large repetitive protein
MPTVSAALVVSPTTLDFTAKAGKQSKAKKITAHNAGKVSITLAGAQITGNFTLSKRCGPLLKPRKHCEYKVVFKPTTTGLQSGLLTIDNNSSSGTQTVTLSGTGK